MKEIKMIYPDDRFAVAVRIVPHGNGHRYEFISTSKKRGVLIEQKYHAIRGMALWGDVESALIAWLSEATNNQIRDAIGLHSTQLAALRAYLKIGYNVGTYGGKRRGSGSKKKIKD